MNIEKQSAIGPVAGMVVIIIVMIVGAIYFVQTTKQVITEREQTAEEIRQSIDAQTESLNSLGTSDEIESIADDAELTNTENLLPELTTMENNL